MFDKIKPIFYVSEENKIVIKKIEELLSTVEILDSKRIQNLKIKSKVRSIHSSLAIESNSLSLEAVANINENKQVLGRKKEIQEVKNAIELYNHINDFDFNSEKDFLKAHTILMQYFDDDNGGYRKHGEGVKKGNEIIFVAPESIIVPFLMKSLFEFLDNKEIHPLLLASIFHYYLVYIHPFTDGNGRIARFWTSLILTKYDSNFEFIPIEEEIYLRQEEYYEAISRCHTNGNANDFIEFMLDAIYHSILKTTQKTTQTSNKVKLNNNQKKIIDLIKEKPEITRNEIATILNITADGVKYNLHKLVKSNIIKRVGPNNGGYWEIDNKLDK